MINNTTLLIVNRYIVITAVLGLYLSIVHTVAAIDLTVRCDGSFCTSSPVSQPLFTEINVAPGNAYIRKVNACNDSTQSLTFALELSSFSDSSPSVGGGIDLTIKNTATQVIVYGPKTFTDLYNLGYVLLDTISANTCRQYDFVVSMMNIGNEFQAKTLTFNIGFGFDAVPEITLTPTPTPIPGSVLGQQATPTPTPVVSTTPTAAPQTTSSDSGNVLAATGTTLIIPLLSGLFLILSSVLVVLSRKKHNSAC